jgi:hypothetical protein
MADGLRAVAAAARPWREYPLPAGPVGLVRSPRASKSRSARPRRFRISPGGRRGRTRRADGPGIGAGLEAM